MSMAAPSTLAAHAVTVTASWLAGVPTVILSPAAKPSARRTLSRSLRRSQELRDWSYLLQCDMRHSNGFDSMANAVDIHRMLSPMEISRGKLP